MVQNNSTGDRLRLFALSKCPSIKDFSDLMGMNTGNVQKYLNEKRKPGSALLKRLQKEGCDINWLLTGEGEMYVSTEGGKVDRDEKTRNSYSTDVKQQQNAHSTPVFNVNDDGVNYRAIDGSQRAMIAIGSRMTPDKIEEGDFLVIETNKAPKAGDYVLLKIDDAPAIARWNAGDPPPIGVVRSLSRSYR